MRDRRDGHPLNDPLVSCERERLDRIGAIQPFGVLLGGDWGDERVGVASADAARWLALPGDGSGLLDRPLGDLVPLGLADFPVQTGQKRVIAGLLQSPEGPLDAILCRGKGGWLLELEPATVQDRSLPVADPWLRRLFQVPGGAEGLDDYSHGLCEAVRRATGFDRVMTYRFLPDGSGEVIAESVAEPPARYLGLRFPASDIPQIARALYLHNSYRQIPDIAVAPVPLVARPGTEPDLTYSDLRAVSPVHLQYLANMGVRASFSTSIMASGALWGLVACHHGQPRQLPLGVRERCAELAHTYALGVASYHANRRLQRLTKADAWVEEVAELVREVEAGVRPAARLDRAILEPLDASGAALVSGTGTRTFGSAPPEAELLALDHWVRRTVGDPVFVTDRVVQDTGLALDPARAAGLIVVQSVSRARGWDPAGSDCRLYWFRPEQPRTVRWAGDPFKPAEISAGGDIVSPRRSFDLWVETARGLSAPWDDVDLIVARKLRILVLRTCAVGRGAGG